MNNYISQAECPYIESQQSTAYVLTVEGNMPSGVYENLIDEGFRRNGVYFYKNICTGCKACTPIRVDANGFQPSRSQRRVLKKNPDIRIVRHPAKSETEGFRLYQKYCHNRHGNVENHEDYMRFLIHSPLSTEMMRYYIKDRLMGLGWIDVLPNALSSVYFAFDPDDAERSPGVFSVLKELELCRKLGKKWLQMGFWIASNPKMAYKNRYHPCHVLVNGKWQQADLPADKKK